MTKDQFDILYDTFAKPLIDEMCSNNSLVVAKDYEKCKANIYKEYESMRIKYRSAVFNKEETELLDRHKVASCICGAILKCSVIDKTELIKRIINEKGAVETYFYYVNEAVAFMFASKVLMVFMMNDYSLDIETQKVIYSQFPIMPQTNCSKVSVFYNVLFNMSQIKDNYQIGIENYDMYSYAMFFYFLECYFSEKKCLQIKK